MGDIVLEVAVQEEACRADRHAAIERFEAVRHETEALTANLTAEDQSIQSMPDVSPTKWHLGHTTWFFETFLLARFDPDYRVFDPAFGYLFNSYYEAVGPRHPRPERGLLSRPTVDIVMAYRDHVGSAMARLIERVAEAEWSEVATLLELGIHHEQQHQELILMDIKHVFSLNPLLPAYQAPQLQVQATAHPLSWVDFDGGLKEIGHSGSGFAFDNESPRHKIWLEPFRLAARPVTCDEYLGFIEEAGYRRPEFWLSDGWATVREQGWEAPLYWLREGEEWSVFTLSGRRRLNPSSRYATSAFTKPMPSPDGRGNDCRPKRNGRQRPKMCRYRATSPMAAIFTLARMPRRTTSPSCGKCTATCGNGRLVLISLTHAFVRPAARSANITENSCAIRSC